MDLVLFLKGMLAGFSIAAPVGPIGILCIRRSLQHGRLAGFVTGAGAALADSSYGMIAALGVTAVTDFLQSHRMVFAFIGGTVLGFVGLRILFSRRMEVTGVPPPLSLSRTFLSSFFLTLTNPATVLAFIGLFSTFGLSIQTYHSAYAVVIGVCAGSLLWWLILSGVSSIFRARVDSAVLLWINRLSGAVMVAFSCFALEVGFSLAFER